MKWISTLCLGLAMALGVQAQTLTLVASSTFSPALNGGAFRGLSGLEYVPGQGWYVVSDRAGGKQRINEGHVFLAKTMPPTADAALLTPQAVPTSLESIRYDAAHELFVLAGERDSVAAGERDSTQVLLLKRAELGQPKRATRLLGTATDVPNKGIEGLALTPSGQLWTVLEAGWPGQTALDQPVVQLRRYRQPAVSAQFDLFSYPIDRFPNAFYESDRHGGIAELLAADDSTLLVLERAYHVFLLRNLQKQRIEREEVLGRIYRVRINEATHTLTKTLAFDFNDRSQFTGPICNLEGMSWGPAGPTGRRRLYVIADDNFEDRPDRLTTQRNQWIVLEEQ